MKIDIGQLEAWKLGIGKVGKNLSVRPVPQTLTRFQREYSFIRPIIDSVQNKKLDVIMRIGWATSMNALLSFFTTPFPLS